MLGNYKKVLTQKGAELHAKCLAGTSSSITFTKFVLGNGTYTGSESTAAIAAMTALRSAKKEYQVTAAEVVNAATCKLTLNASNLEVTQGFYVTEIGVYAKGSDNAEVLYSVTVADPEHPDWMPAYNNVAPGSLRYLDYISVGNADDITINVSPGGLVSVEDFIEVKQFLENRLDEQAIALRQTRDSLNEVVGFSITTNLTNTESYPFNNSKKTVALTNEQERVNTDYKVTVEASSVTGGFLEDVIITDKLVNGFKVEYTGSATAATLKLYVSGGK